MAATNDAALRAETQGPLVNSLALIFVAFSTISVTLRQYTRKFMLDAIGPDDITIACAQMLAIGVSVITVLGKSSLFSYEAMLLTVCRGILGTR